MSRDRLAYLLIPLAALIAIFPLLLNGCSCGHDFNFHLLSWMEAARQFTQGTLHPHWTFTAAYNAGEPRFIFYPPASWTLGAILGLLFPWTWTPILYTWLALTASGLALHRLAREFTAPSSALLAAVIYVVNPYMLFTAYERTAYAELLAAAIIPLLLHGILRRHLTISGIAIPVALVWLTNAPAAVMSCYTLALLAIVRLATTPNAPPFVVAPHTEVPNERSCSPGSKSTPPTRSARQMESVRDAPGAPSSARFLRLRWASRRGATAPAHAPSLHQSSLQQARAILAGTSLGLGLAAFYIVPAAYERRFVQIAMALVPGTRIQDNFLFHHTGDLDHDAVLYTVSVIAVLLLAAITLALVVARRATKPGAPYLDLEMWASRGARPSSSSRPENPPIPPPGLPKHRRRVPYPSQSHRDRGNTQSSTTKSPFFPLAILTAAIALLLTPLTALLWRHAPELAFLQFPWRLLAILAAVLALSLALALTRLQLKPVFTATLGISIAAALTWPAYLAFRQPCDPDDTVSARLAVFRSNQGSEPTDEYTPITANNDSLARNNPPWWLSPDPDANAPTNAPSGPAPTHLTLESPTAQTLILNLRDYPSWRITRNQTLVINRQQRDDGLIALLIPTGTSTISIAYAQAPDQTLGDIITAISLLLLIVLFASCHRRTP